MNDPENICPSCERGHLVDGVCTECGYSEKPILPQLTPFNPPENRGPLWLLFFAIFLGTPVLALLSGAQGIVPVLGLGTLASGFLLSKLFVNDKARFAIFGIVFSAGIFAVYLGIAFVGCLVMLKNHPL